MKYIFAFLLIFLCNWNYVSASESWRPTPDESYIVGDPRFEALDSYKDVLILIRTYSFIKSHCNEKPPTSDVDYLLADFEQEIAAPNVVRALGYLKKYPDYEVASKLLQFQIDKTSGVLPVWKLLVLFIFDNYRLSFDKIFKTFSAEKRAKLLGDIELALTMSESNGQLVYSLTEERRKVIKADIQKMKRKP